MNRFVTRKEYLDLKDWMLQNFVTQQAFNLLVLEVSHLKQEVLKLTTEFHEFKDTTTSRFDKVFERLERLDQERIAQHEATSRLESGQAEQHEILRRIEEKLDRLGKAS